MDDRARWNEKWLTGHASGEPPAWWAEHEALLPRQGRALDVACGTGRGALGWAQRGLSVTGVDVSDVGLERARDRLAEQGHGFTAIRADLSTGSLPEGTWDAVSVLHFRPLGLWSALRGALSPGGVLVVEVLHIRNAVRNPSPGRKWLAEPGEVAAGLEGLEVLFLEEGWVKDRALARAIARRV